MKTDSFIHQRVSFVDAFSYVNGWPPVSDENICETCTNLLESAYVFRQMCRVADHPIYNVCRCCLQEKLDSNDQFLNIRNAAFMYNNKKVTFFEGYLDVNNYALEDSTNFTNSDVSICEGCAMQLQSAYIFQRMCQKTAEIIQQQNKESGQEYIRLNSNNWRSYNTNKKKSRKAAEQRTAIKFKIDQHNLKSRRHHDIQQIRFSFSCKKCPKTFNSKIRLSSHRIIKHKDVRTTRGLFARLLKRKSTLHLSCEKCQIVFKTRQNHSSHNRSVHQIDCTVRVLQQQDSVKEFNSSSRLNTLKKSVHEKLQYRCKKCPKTFQSHYLRTNHVHKEHLNISYDCKDCDKVFNTPASLRQHNLGHGKTLHQCEKCPKAFRRRSYLLRHIETKHENLRLACQDCDKVFKSYGGLYNHKTTFHSMKLFKCKFCDKIYKSPTSLHYHTNAMHLNKIFQCEKCSKIYQRRDQFIRHYRSKHLNIVFACQDCDKVFISKNGLKSHKASIHLKIIHQCEQCPKNFFEKRGLRAHVEKIHAEKQYSCQDCNKIFTTQRGLTRHKNNIHLKKLLKCKNCEKTFNNLSSRDHHNTKEHLKLTFKCQKCKKILANKSSLAVHIQKVHPNNS
jgi:uncharacterized C2H2 Zn-finger protein